ncbi:MAG: hypothetical protein KAU21_11185, partial [Gammaproteobacteria bacterium]|nr:hypothetical protein [Gammaproteobacteria bacterium]
NLLETNLSQLMKISADSASSDYVAGGASVLDELSGLLSETEIDNNENVSDTSVSSGEVNEYVSSIELDHDSFKDETVATDSVLDELKELLDKPDDMGTEIPVSSSASEYSVADVYEETSLLDPLEDLLSGPGETDDPVLVSDSSSVSVLDAVDTDKNENEKSVLEEFAAYMDGSSDLPGVGIEAPEQETETASAFDESDTLKQLEAMLNESSVYTDEKSSETIQLNEHDSSIEYAAPQLSGNNEKEKYEDDPTVNNRVRPADVKAENLVQDSLAETKNNNRMPIVGMSLLAVAVIGAIAFWNLSADQESNHSLARQNRSLEKTEIVKAKSDFIAQPVIVEAEPWRQAEVKPAEYETEPSYKNETYDSYEKAQYDLYEEPAPYDVYEPLNNEVIDPVLEVDELQMQQPDVVPQVGNEITENRIIELIVEQIQLAQNNNETSIALEDNTSLLSERLTAVELSISELQFSIEKTQQLQFARPANPDTSKVNTEDQIKQVQEKTEKNFDLLNGRVTDTESSVSNLQHAVEEMQQRVAMSPVSPDASTVATVDQIKQLQDENKNNLSLLNKHFVAVEASISKLQYAVEEMQQRVAMSPVSADTSLKATENQITRVQEKNEKSFGLLNERVIDTESSISKLQLAVEKYKQLGPVQSVSSIASKMNTAYSSKLAAGELTDQTYTIWSVHLLSFYGKPPPVGELDFLDDAGVPYKIKRTIVKGGVWYRVLVNNSSEYSLAKEYAEMLKARLGIKEIWLSKKQYTYD